MSAPINQEHLALLKFGIFLPVSQRDEAIRAIKSNPSFKEDFERIKASLKTMYDEDDFLETINSSHLKIAEVPQNSKVISQKQHTFQIRAINPEHITSLTQRAFFNSFNLQRNVLNDLQQQNIYQDRKREQPRKQTKRVEDQVKPQPDNDNQEEQKCICGKIIHDAYWIQCCNQSKCRGSGWYHLECAAVKVKPQQIEKIEFICSLCKREDEKESSQNKRFKSS